MKRTDRFLYGMVLMIVLLMVVTFVIAYLRPAPTYQADDTPEGTVHNYLLALQTQDYEKAYLYLNNKLPGYPGSAEQFSQHISRNSWTYRNMQTASFDVQPSNRTWTSGSATITVHELRFQSGGLFDSSEKSNTFNVYLKQVQGKWTIEKMDSYWVYCWSYQYGCN